MLGTFFGENGHLAAIFSGKELLRILDGGELLIGRKRIR
jgi:hypothetical protein